MRRRQVLAALPIFVSLPAFAAEEKLSVVATFSVLADMARRIGGMRVRVHALTPTDGDAHQYQPTPDDLRRVRDAATLVENGLGLEGWMSRLPEAAGFHGVRIVAARAVWPLNKLVDGKSVADPHAWQDPRNGALYARAIAEGLAQANPAAADEISANAAAYIAEIKATDRWIEEQMAQIPAERRRILTSHDAFGYYGARYGVELLSVQGISTEDEPSAAKIAKLIGQIKKLKVRAVFVERMTSPRYAETVARDSGAVLGAEVYSDALSAPDGPAATYLAMLRHNTMQFVAAMK
jgi:zinc/manganese transport system substrate-binding protein